MARTKKFTADEVITALRGTGGVKKLAADRLGVDRRTITNYVRDFPTVRAAWLDERLSLRDAAEVGLMRQIQNGNYKAIAFALTYIDEDGAIRPPAQRHEVAGPDGAALVIQMTWGDTDAGDGNDDGAA